MTNNFELSAYSRDDLFKNMEWLSEQHQNIRKENNSAMPKGARRKMFSGLRRFPIERYELGFLHLRADGIGGASL